jgi:hypothetical protein
VQTYCRHGALPMQTISEKIVASLPLPGLVKNRKQRSNELHYFSGATLQGKKAPAGSLPSRDFSSQKARCL